MFGTKADTTFKATEDLVLTAYFEAIPAPPVDPPAPPQPTQYTISVSSANNEWGTVSITGSGTYEENTDVTITATANEGYRFVDWKNGESVFCTKADTTFKATEDLTLMAYFEAIPAPPEQIDSITIVVQANKAEWGSVQGGGKYEKNTDVTITATANEGYRFVSWKDGEIVFSTMADTTFKATDNLHLTAYFDSIREPQPPPPSADQYVYVVGRVIYLPYPMGYVQLFSITGQCVYEGTATAIMVREKGLYILCTQKKHIKVLVLS